MGEITCVGINYLNECNYATLCSGYFGCKFDKPCKYQRPEIVESRPAEGCESILKTVYEEISTNTGSISKSTAMKIFKYFNPEPSKKQED